jgi:hypothetical protein
MEKNTGTAKHTTPMATNTRAIGLKAIGLDEVYTFLPREIDMR